MWNFLYVSKSTHSTLLKITDSFGQNDAKVLKALFLFCLFSFRNTKLIAVSLVWSAQTRVVKKLHCKKTFKSTWPRNALCGRNCVNTAKQASFFAKERWKLLLMILQPSGKWRFVLNYKILIDAINKALDVVNCTIDLCFQ